MGEDQRIRQRCLETAIIFGLRTGGESLDLFNDRPANVFIIKANYWLSL